MLHLGRELIIGLVGDQWISKSSLSKLDMPEYSLKVDHPFTGEEGYRVGMEVFHYLHCLNLLRRVTYKEYYEPLGGEFAAGPDDLRHHTGRISWHLNCSAQMNTNIART
jgi:Mycotoxin biosynthesis protein UstYa